MMASDNCFAVVEQTLSDDLAKLRNYFYNWRLKLNTPKTVCSALHLTNRIVDYELSITTMVEWIPFDKTLKHLGVTHERTLSYHQYYLNTQQKYTNVAAYCRNLPANTGEPTSQLCVLLHFFYVLLLPNTVVQYEVKSVTAKTLTQL